MCSIFGYNKKNEKLLNSFFSSMKHRGPDNDGSTYVDGWTIGQQRLSIIDTSRNANQPMKNGNNHLSFNGEIYNYIELKNKYLKKIKLKTNSDTEVLLELLSKKGLSILNELNGMFAFSWYNTKSKELILVRDRFGVKPLYWMKQKENIYFSSETKPLVKLLPEIKLSEESVESFLKETSSDYSENSFIKGISQVIPGHYIKINSQKKISKHSWYKGKDFKFNKYVFDNRKKSYDFFENLLVDSIKLRHRSDVPIGLTLSGGLDSSSIYVLIKERLDEKIQPITFSNPNSPINELKIVKRLIKEYKDELLIIKAKSKYKSSELIKVLKYLEFPIWNPSFLAYHDLYKKISLNGYKVVIEGHGSDEQLGGYPYMINEIWRNLAQNWKFRDAYRVYCIYKKTLNTSIGEKYLQIPFPLILFKVLIEKCYKKYNAKKTIEDSFNRKILPMVLRAFDRIPMSQGIESRSPYLDYRIVEYLKLMPIEHKVNELGSKAPLRYILKKYHKDYIFKNFEKTGFAIDIIKLLKSKSIRNMFKKYLIKFDFPGFSQEKIKLKNIENKKNISWNNIVSIWKLSSLAMIKEIYDEK